MTRRSSRNGVSLSKAIESNADTTDGSVTVSRPVRRVRMKSPKRKREAAAAAVAPAPAKQRSAPVVALSSNCSLKDAAELKTALCKVLDEPAAVTLDVRSVERIDTATVQLLCAFVRDRGAQGRAVAWLGEPEAIAEAVRLLGVQDMLVLAPAQVTGAAA
jgi:ABC-type transporter Mla MlaB component